MAGGASNRLKLPRRQYVATLEARQRRLYAELDQFRAATGCMPPQSMIDRYARLVVFIAAERGVASQRQHRRLTRPRAARRTIIRVRRIAAPAGKRMAPAAPPSRPPAGGERAPPPAEPEPAPRLCTLFGDPLDPPPPELAATLERFKKASGWRLLTPDERFRVECHLRSGSPAKAVLIEDILAAAALARNENPGTGELWIGPEIPPGALLVRERGGFWRVMQFDRESTAAEAWNCWGGRA